MLNYLYNKYNDGGFGGKKTSQNARVYMEGELESENNITSGSEILL